MREQYAWSHYYWTLTDEGVAYLRDYLHLPESVKPKTLVREAKSTALPPAMAPRGPAYAPAGDKQGDYASGGRQAYRQDDAKLADAGSIWNLF